MEALEWMKANVPNNTIVASWWDYGYWISFIAGKKTLADNGTMNITRISLLAEMFLSDEDRGIEIMKKLGAEYVVIYLGAIEVSSQQGGHYVLLRGFGEEGKFIQMAKILGENPDIYINRSNSEGSIYTDAFWNTFLGHLIPYKFVQKQSLGGQQVDVYQYNPKYPTIPNKEAKLILVYKTSDPGYGEVIVYKLVNTTSS
jgi:dolichyl-diphosphooligosaccharide--protein glycosyltransferase